MSAAAAVFAAPAAVAAGEEAAAGVGLDAPDLPSEVRFWVSRASSAGPPLLPEELIAVASNGEAPPASVVVVLAALPLAVAGAAGTPTRAAAKACCRSVKALDAGSAAECAVGVSLDSSGPD